MPAEEVPEGEGDEYPDGEEQSPEDTLGYAELTTDELKAAFRIFDDIGDGFISVEKFKMILGEICEDFTDEELDEVILEVDLDKSTTIDFNEFVKIMTL